jgi:carboxypeptidase Q
MILRNNTRNLNMKTFAQSIRTSLLFLLLTLPLYPQTPDSTQPYVLKTKQIITSGLESGRAYEMLYELTKIGPRLSGSPQAARAVEWARRKMEELGLERVHLEPVMVPHWVRGPVEEASVVNSRTEGNLPLKVCALGGSIATPEEGITAPVMEVKSFEELQERKGEAKGKIIFYNRPMDRSKIDPFEAYGGAVNERSQGPIEAARVGGVAVLVRSMTTRLDDVAHTGSTHYADSIPKIPAVAISTVGAELLSGLIARGKRVTVRLKLTCQTLPDAESANVIGELTGSEKPQEVVVVGAHLDSWDKGQGAHDDGAGCVQVLEALRLLKGLGFQPRRTIRGVLFMNEENGLRGGRAYADKERSGEKHILAIESDAGGFSPQGFGIEADSITFQEIARWVDLLKPIDADRTWKGGGGADISALGKEGVPLAGMRVDPQRYFDYHHSDSDTIDKVNERELSYVVAEEGLDVDRSSRHAGTR